jgi:hypothetical protein
MTEDRLIEREEAELLLPWYERGTLRAEDMRRVEARLAADPMLRTRLELIREEAVETIAAVESAGMPSRGARDRLMAQIAAEAGATPASRSLRDWLTGLLPAGLSPALAVMAAAAVLVIALQAAALVALMSSNGADDTRLASGEDTARGAGTYVLVGFAESANAGQIAEFLRAVGAVIVDGPKPGGTYKLRISAKTLTEAERERALTAIRARADLIAFVQPTQ